MPRGDGTGPMGLGPMTGWGAGCCAGGFPGRGMYFGGPRFGRGLRRMPFAAGGAWREGPWAPGAWPQEKEVLTSQAAFLQGRLEEIRQRLTELEQKAAE